MMDGCTQEEYLRSLFLEDHDDLVQIPNNQQSTTNSTFQVGYFDNQAHIPSEVDMNQQEELNKNMTQMSLETQNQRNISHSNDSSFHPVYGYIDRQAYAQANESNQLGIMYDQSYHQPHLQMARFESAPLSQTNSLPCYQRSASEYYQLDHAQPPLSQYGQNLVESSHYLQGGGGNKESFQMRQKGQYFQNEGYNSQYYMGQNNISPLHPPPPYYGYENQGNPQLTQNTFKQQQSLPTQDFYQDYTHKQTEYISQQFRHPMHPNQQYFQSIPPNNIPQSHPQFQQYQQPTYFEPNLNNYQVQNAIHPYQENSQQLEFPKPQPIASVQAEQRAGSTHNLEQDAKIDQRRSSASNIHIQNPLFISGLPQQNEENSKKKNRLGKSTHAIPHPNSSKNNATHKRLSMQDQKKQNIERKYKKLENPQKSEKRHRSPSSQIDLSEQLSLQQTPQNEQDASQVSHISFSASCLQEKESEQKHNCCHGNNDDMCSESIQDEYDEENEQGKQISCQEELSSKNENLNPSNQKADEVAILADSIKHCNKKNVVKNIMSAFLTFMNDRKYKIYTEEEQSVIPALFRSQLSDDVSIEDDKLEGIRQKFKRYIAPKSLNHYTVRLLIKHQNYGPIFKHFISKPIEKWIHNSKVSDLGAHVKMIGFFHACFQDPQYLEELKRHEKKRAHFS